MAKILIVEDDKIISEMYALKFTNAWHEVEEALDGLKWLVKIAEFKPDAILLDIMMPSMNGFETLEAIKAQTSSKCKIVMFTNVIDQDKIDQAMEAWADDYLIKANTNPSDAVEKIETLLDIKHEDENIYVKLWENNFKMKNPNGWKDIDVKVNIEL